MYRNLEAELARRGITQAEIARLLGMTPTTLSLKLNGKSNLTLPECIKIKNIIGVDIIIEKLFETSDSA